MDLDISPIIAAILVISGICVGFINTLAGGATVISMTVFLLLGLPLGVANGTNRIAVVLQNLTSSANFIRKKTLDVSLGLKLSIPTIVGCVIGSQVAVTINEQIFRWCLGAVMGVMLIFMVLSKNETLKGNGTDSLNVRWVHYLWFLLIGFYSGYIYVGLGYLILVITIMSLKMDIVRANALKGFVVLISTPFSLAVFIYNGQIDILYGVVHAVGNIMGAYLASQYAHMLGVGFIRWLMIIVITIFMADMFGLISLKQMIGVVLG